MSITEEVNRIIGEQEKKMAEGTGSIELAEFYAEMRRLGIAKKQEYSLPPLDTIGRQLYRSMSSANNK